MRCDCIWFSSAAISQIKERQLFENKKKIKNIVQFISSCSRRTGSWHNSIMIRSVVMLMIWPRRMQVSSTTNYVFKIESTFVPKPGSYVGYQMDPIPSRSVLSVTRWLNDNMNALKRTSLKYLQLYYDFPSFSCVCVNVHVYLPLSALFSQTQRYCWGVNWRPPLLSICLSRMELNWSKKNLAFFIAEMTFQQIIMISKSLFISQTPPSHSFIRWWTPR